MKILQVTPYYPPHWGGMEIIASKVTHGLRKRGYRVKVATTQTSDNSLENDPEVYRVPVNFRVFNTPVSFKAYGLISELAQDVDLIHTYGYPVFFSDLAAYVASDKVPFVLEWVIDPREAPAYRDSAVAKLATDLYMSFHGNKVFRRAKAVVTLSKSHKRCLANMGVPEEKIEVIPCGIDTELFNPEVSPADVKRDCEHVLLYAGRISSQKGVDILLNAFPEILMEHPKTLLAIAGLCDQPAYWRKIQQSLTDLRNNIMFLGSMSQSQLAMYYRAADVVVFPSRYESFGMVPLEASACGTAVVSTLAGAVEDATKKVAYLVENEEPAGIARAVNFLLSHPDLREKMGAQAAELVKKEYSWETALDKYEAVYRKGFCGM